MSIDAHLAELERRHQALDREIQEARRQPSFNDLDMVKLKRRKLHLKDEMSRFEEQTLH